MEDNESDQSSPPPPATENELKMLQQVRMILALKHAKTDGQPAEIFPFLYLGSIGAAMSKSNLQRLGVTHVLCVADNIGPQYPQFFTYKSVEILDTAQSDLLGVFDDCFRFIDLALAAQGKVLLHCFAGKSRSASVCIAYIMKTQRISLLEAFRYVRERRPVVLPNTGFMKQLKTYEISLGLSPNNPEGTEVIEETNVNS